MGIRNKKRETLRRLDSKTLDAKFLQEIQHGLNCSPFEAEAVLEVVKEVYFPFLDEQSVKAPPGKVTLIAVSADEPAGKPVADCEKQNVCLTIHRGLEDDRILQEKGPAGFRQARIPEICQEALSQGALLTREDLAYRVFFVSPRTISRDLNILRQAEPAVTIPLRSTVHDIGPVLTHRTRIVRLALEGKTMTQICFITRHTPPAVNNYISTFVRCVQLARKKMQVGQIAFLLRRGRGLIRQYLDLLAQCDQDQNMAYHLEELMRLGTCSGEKKVRSGEEIMVNKTDSLRGGLQPLLDRTLENALAYRIAKEFPRIGGPRIRKLCAEMVLEVVHRHIRAKDCVQHGQVLWTAVSRDHPPARRQRIAESELVSVILDISTAEDVKARMERKPETPRKLQKALRLCRQAYEQGGVLSNLDLSELINMNDSWIGRILVRYERQNGKIVPRRATIHDVGTGLSHKWIICRKRYVDGKSPDQVARETYHSLDAVDRYLGQFDRVRHCHCQGLSAAETAHILNCGVSLVETYLQIDKELEGKDA